MSAAARRRLSWVAVLAGIALAVGLSIWLIAEKRSLAELGAAVSGDFGPYPGGPVDSDYDQSRGNRPERPRLEIKSIGVSAHAIDLGLRPDGSLEVPKNFEEVGLWKHGPAPGEVGPAVIAGHVDSFTAPAVFYKLRRLGRGDRVRWESANGSLAIFEVTRKEEHPKAEFPTARVYGKTRRPELRLITCSGPADASGHRSINNLIVYARQVGGDA